MDECRWLIFEGRLASALLVLATHHQDSAIIHMSAFLKVNTYDLTAPTVDATTLPRAFGWRLCKHDESLK
jgi:hypothetical protein